MNPTVPMFRVILSTRAVRHWRGRGKAERRAAGSLAGLIVAVGGAGVDWLLRQCRRPTFEALRLGGLEVGDAVRFRNFYAC